MERWQFLLKSGNDYFDQGQWLKAEQYYQSAFNLLEDQWLYGSQYEDLLIAWICASHNLATLFETIGKLDASLQYLLVAHNKVQHISENEESSPSLQSLAFNAMKTTINPILLYTKKHPICDNCKQEWLQIDSIISCENMTKH